MRILVTVIVYNRFENIRHWISCWKQADQTDAELVIIHNYYGDEVQRKRFSDYCTQHGVRYVARNKKGFDIGGFQDVCRERLEGFPNDWDYILWMTDDTFPMQKDFVKPFIESLKPGVGLSCMQISKSTPGNIIHVRTTGFAVSKEVALQITFPCDPVTTKQDCYIFEHRGGKNILSEQIRAMGLSVVQVAPNATSPLWDSGFWKRLDRINEHNKTFGFEQKGDKVVFVCPIFNMYPQLISSLICQTHKNWELLLIHNGPCDSNLKNIISSYQDKRINFIEYPENTGQWGHVLRQWALNEIANDNMSDADYVVITNADNYHVPTYCEYMLRGFKKNPIAKAVYCSDMVHNYKAWQVIPCSLKVGFIDCAGVMVKRSVACEVGWRDTTGHSSDWTYFSDIITAYSHKSFEKVTGCLLVHN